MPEQRLSKRGSLAPENERWLCVLRAVDGRLSPVSNRGQSLATGARRVKTDGPQT
jgi:hypothetical protein